MSLTKITFTKDWTNPSDFPTVETSEAVVRDDMQVLYDEIKTGVNNIVDQLEGTSGAANMGITPITGVTATNVQEALSDLKTQVDTKAPTATVTAHTSNTSNPHSVTKAQVGLGNVDNTSDTNKPISTATATALALKETIADADLLVKNVTFTPADGRFTFTKQGGGTIVIDTNLEKVPGSMALIESPVGSGAYYLVIYDTSVPPVELSRCPVSALFNAINVEDTATVNLVLASDTAGKKKLTANVKDGSITFAKLDSLVQGRISTLESHEIDGVTDTSTIDLGISSKKITASVKDGSITAAKLEAGLYEEIEGFKDAAETAATNAAASETNASGYADAASAKATQASGYADNASGYATAASNSATSASGYATNASSYATNAQSWAVGGTSTRSGEDTNNAKYWCEQASTAVSGQMMKSVYDPNNTVATAGGIVDYVADNGGKIDKIQVNGVDQPIVNKTVNLPAGVQIDPSTTTEGDVWIETDGEGATGTVVTKVNGSYGDVTITAAGIGAYVKPSGGIPDTDIASAATWNAKQNALPANSLGNLTYTVVSEW